MKLHILSHTHWDREWFLSAYYTREWLPPFFESLFRILEQEADAKFVLDGQLLMIEDYLELLEERGQDIKAAKQKIADFAQKGQLILGPYYLQPDWQLISEESAVRNLLAGKRLGEKLGPVQKMGWLLDCFGQIAQMSQIHDGFGVEGTFVWRGVELEPESIQTEFLWQSPDGTVLPASYLLDSYRNAMRLNWDQNIATGRIQYVAQKLKPYSSSSNILFMNGYDQEMEPENIPALLREHPEIPAVASSPEAYMQAVLDTKPQLETLTGALNSGRYISVFPGILSARMPIKQRNYYCEKLLERYVEPLLSMAMEHGLDYPLEELQTIWLELMKNHPHDTICGVSVDALYREFAMRCDYVEERSLKWVQEAVGKLLPEKGLSFYNPSGFARFDIVEIPSEKYLQEAGITEAQQLSNDGQYLLETDLLLGGSLSSVMPPAKKGIPVKCFKHSEAKYVIDNGILKVEILQDGRLNLSNPRENLEFTGLHFFEDGADAGDTYNYSPCRQDQIITSKGCDADISIVEHGPLRARIQIKLQLEIPARLTEDRYARSKDTRKLSICSFVTLKKNARSLEFCTYVQNSVRDHRLRVCFPTSLETDTSYADTQFAVTPHPIDPPMYSDEGLDEDLKKILLGAREPSPVSCFPQRQFVDLSDGKNGLAVLNKGLPEYEVKKVDRTIALTLFRSVGWLARTDLLERIGDAGPQIATPRAQVLEDMCFEYALYPHQGGWETGEVLSQAEQFNHPTLVVAGTSPSKNYSFLPEVLPPQLKWTAYKCSEDGNNNIIRLLNYSTSPCKFLPAGWEETDLAEEVTISKKNEGFRSFEIKTFRCGPLKARGNSQTSIKPALLWQEKAPKQQKILSGLSAVEREALVEKVEVASEQTRWLELEERCSQIRKAMVRAEGRKRLDLELELYTLERGALEAQISFIYLGESLKNPDVSKDSAKIEAKMHEIGLKLNHARVNKRAFEYIHQYYVEVLGW